MLCNPDEIVYKAKSPTIPTAPARPAPITAVGTAPLPELELLALLAGPLFEAGALDVCPAVL